MSLADGRVLVVGGADRTDRTHFRTTEIYDARTATFERGPAMANHRYKIAGTSIALPDGDILITSGARAVELLDHRTGTFREIAGMFTVAAPIIGNAARGVSRIRAGRLRPFEGALQGS